LHAAGNPTRLKSRPPIERTAAKNRKATFSHSNYLGRNAPILLKNAFGAKFEQH
jgi:hypothetical protein